MTKTSTPVGSALASLVSPPPLLHSNLIQFFLCREISDFSSLVPTLHSAACKNVFRTASDKNRGGGGGGGGWGGGGGGGGWGLGTRLIL